MDTIFSFNDNNNYNKINLDELYEKKREKDLRVLNTYNQILNRIHKKIKNVSMKNSDIQFCCYIVPEIIIGVSNYNNTNCISYVIHKLQENGFIINYTHPNLLFISWKHWTPSYVRNEIKKKSGISIDGYGNKINKSNDITAISRKSNKINTIFGNNDKDKDKDKKDERYKDVKLYKPTGKFIYNHIIENL